MAKESLYLVSRRVDPTKTLTLRKEFRLQMRGRFLALSRLIIESVDDNNCFGYGDSAYPKNNTYRSLAAKMFAAKDNKTNWDKWRDDLFPIGTRRFQFMNDPDKISSFMDWLDEMEDRSVLRKIYSQRIGPGIVPAWTNLFIKRAYAHGILFARHLLRGNKELLIDINKQKLDFPIDDISIDLATDGAIHADRIGVAYTRTFNDLKGITDTMNAQISREIASGLTLGINPREIARNIVNRVDKIGINRATILARTEVIRANHLAAIQEYRNAGITAVQVKAEWSTAGDARVCELCSPLDGKVFDLDEIEPKIPLHPQCRCAAIPVINK